MQGNGVKRQNPCNFGGPCYFHVSFKVFVDSAFEFLFDSKILGIKIFGGGTMTNAELIMHTGLAIFYLFSIVQQVLDGIQCLTVA